MNDLPGKSSLEEDMARYKPYKYDQMVLVPVSFQEQLEPGTFEYTLNELVEKHLDLSVFEACYQNDRSQSPRAKTVGSFHRPL